MSNSDIEQSGTVKGHFPNVANLSGRISNGLSLSGHISIGSVASDFIIKMTLAGGDDGHYTLASCDATVEQIDAAVAAEKRVVVMASDGSITFELPMLQGAQGVMYAFGTFMSGQMMTSFVQKIGGDASEWQFLVTQIQAESVDYSNTALPNVTNVRGALDDAIDTQQTQSADLESLRSGVSALIDAYETQGGDIASLKTQAHTHTNKSVLDKFAETDGKPIYNGEALGGGASDFIIKMTVETDDDVNYTITSCDATFEQVDAAVAAEKRVVLFVSAGYAAFELPMLECIEGSVYYFGIFLNGYTVISFVQKIDESTSKWQFLMTYIQAESVSYSNAALPNGVTNVKMALDELVPKYHTHANKDTLDKLSVLNGKLQYNGSDVGLKGDKGDTPVKGTDYWTAADKTEIVNDTLAALPTWTGGSY